MVNASIGLTWSFVGLALVVAAAFVAAVYRAASVNASSSTSAARQTLLAAIATAVWLALTLALAAGGLLSFSSRPPTMVILLVATFALAIVIGTSRLGQRLATGIPLVAFVAIQGFRFPLELMLHQAYAEGLMPVQMSFSGFNFDIITGLSAIVVALVLVWKPASLVLVRIWNMAGIVLLVNILTIAILSAPTPLRAFHNEPANVWIERAPWVWLPTVYVLAAIVGHILVYRGVRAAMSARPNVNTPSSIPVSTRSA